MIPQYVTELKGLNLAERQRYEKEVRIYFDGLRLVWKDIIWKYLKYKRPNLVNSSAKEQLNNLGHPLYVYPTFMKSGKQYYMVKHKTKDTGEVKWFPNHCIVRFREEEIFEYDIKLKRNVAPRRFIKEVSVFAKWKLDDSHTVKKCLEHDFRWWKLSKFIKNKSDKDRHEIEQLKNAIRKHFDSLKAIHLQMASKSMFPAVSMADWTTFSKKASLADKYLA